MKNLVGKFALAAAAAGVLMMASATAQAECVKKAGSGTGVPRGYHIHADGSLHKNEDEGK